MQSFIFFEEVFYTYSGIKVTKNFLCNESDFIKLKKYFTIKFTS
jgi:hypothetical protein